MREHSAALLKTQQDGMTQILNMFSDQVRHLHEECDKNRAEKDKERLSEWSTRQQILAMGMAGQPLDILLQVLASYFVSSYT